MFFISAPFIASVFCLATLAFGATRLPNDEVEALRDIAKTLGKTDWNFSVDPCSGESGWADLNPVKGSENAVTCNCSFSDATICHIISIVLKSQNLRGTLPKDLGRLPFLQEIDLSRNYLNGTIPPQWGSMQLVNISLLGNRLTGPIPKEIGNISTLANLTVECNQLSGGLPRELGSLNRIERMLLNSNNFTGQLPATFANLTTLKDFRIGDSQFTGPIPNFIQNWTNLEKLRISDLSDGTETRFPPLSNMKNLKTLILRSCNILGQLPDFLGGMSKLKTLDLSFNKLTGEIPPSLSGAVKTDYIYLTGNLLNGTVPDWILEKGENVDLSYNNFTIESSCQQRTVNLFGSSSMGNVSTTVSCLRSYHCPKYFYSFHINCGGKEAMSKEITYEDDVDSAGPSRFYQSRTNWAFSSTGNFMDDDRPTDSYTCTNSTELSAGASALYMDARLSPLSLTYYGFCMGNGNYTVRLHFAEIMFTDDNTYSSLGRRLFDIYIQGKLVQNDFNIEDEAGGVGKAIIKNFTAIVTSHTLEIRFYWDGKGTTDFVPPPESGSNISAGTVVGIVVAVVAIIILVLGVLWWKGCLRHKDKMDQDLRGLDIQTGSFTLKQIKAATNNFDPANKIGEGGFGSVYKGFLSDGTIIAVKQLSSKSKQGNREFVNDWHDFCSPTPHLVKLYGCCIEGNQCCCGYMAPEYAMRGYLTDKADVYSFGVVALEIVSGRSNTSYRQNVKEECFYLLDWALVLKEKGSLLELVDPKLGKNYNKEQVMTLINVALLCTGVSPVVRPTMSSVVSMLEGKASIQDLVLDSSVSQSHNEMRIEAMRKHFQHCIDQDTSTSMTQSMSLDGPWTGSSTSAQDLYPLVMDSDYWEKRN
ncbi:hypothetical protein GH714_011001 [Hevea brasiliensis]|uniref:non-specific serine/threonine protein kinase n=1 Tax=Hevea brasiliensis TaxID=3981 RepID=A0A6A6KBA7_HEVBR|nr:hypothetical protein GH714_011001 [Hevea brasiliensis]